MGLGVLPELAVLKLFEFQAISVFFLLPLAEKFLVFEWFCYWEIHEDH